MGDARLDMAVELFRKAYQLQMQGELDLAVSLYKRSIDLYPTAEAYTYLGWTYGFQGKLDQAIAECKRAIAIDPGFGNPYNDIGAYLIEKGRHDEAIPWLEQATCAVHYDAYHFPWFNLGRVYFAKDLYRQAGECWRKCLEIDPDYTPAREALNKLKRMLQ
jgi:tetratricopeptide (TPR) repeat protein